MISALTLLGADESAQARDKWSYIGLVEELRRVSVDPKKDADELFRRMCFNALISNTDDHPRNHAILAKAREWKLSPAYDLTPAPQVAIERRNLAMICGDQGRVASARNLLSQSARFLLSDVDAGGIVAAMKDRVKGTWYDVARRGGLSEKDCERIAGRSLILASISSMSSRSATLDLAPHAALCSVSRSCRCRRRVRQSRGTAGSAPR
jgi:serine/threonine-protein kinase HipA